MQSVSSGAVYNKLSWKTLSGNTLPNDSEYEELSISVWVEAAEGYEVLYSNTYAKGQLGDYQNIIIGGYYIAANDFGLCNLTLLNNTLSIRNVYFGGTNYTSSASIKIRYR